MNELHVVGTKALRRALKDTKWRASDELADNALHVVGTKALLRSMRDLDLSGDQKALIDILNEGRLVTYDEIIDELWGFDPDGGPLWAEETLRLRIWRLRRKGYPIRSHSNRRYSLGIG